MIEEEEAMEYVSKEEVSEAIKIKQMELEMQRDMRKRNSGTERNRHREKEIQLQTEIKERELEARIFIEKKKNILTLLNTFVLFLLSMKMRLTSISFFLKK